VFEISDLILFAFAGLALNLTPGPDMLYCATRAASQGKAAGVLSAIGGAQIIHLVVL
jgi:threonine/homoserine/homoserine lactone efflux protein